MKLPQRAEFLGALASGTTTNRSGARLSPLQRQVVGVALCDTLASLGEDGLMARTARLLFGGRRSPKLADPGLEALRRFAVLVRHAPGSLNGAEIERMHAAGFSDRQMDEVFTIIERAPARPVVRLAGAVLLVALSIGAGFAAFAWLRTVLGDPLVAAVVLATVVLPFLAMLWPRTRR
jgi:alkylhydroperoxidase family enzyme